MTPVSDETLRAFLELPSCFVVDAMRALGISGWTEGVMPMSRRARRIAGRAVTMEYGPKSTGEARRITADQAYELIRGCGHGDALVLAGGGTRCWLLGENICHAALYQGMAGIIADGCSRDVDEIAEMDFPVFCLGAGIRPADADLELLGVNGPVHFAGAEIQPGDIVVGDGDGVAIVPSDRAEQVLLQAKHIAEVEKEQEENIKRMAPMDVLRRTTARKWVRGEDSTNPGARDVGAGREDRC